MARCPATITVPSGPLPFQRIDRFAREGHCAVTIVEDALEVWREAERLLDRITPVDPDHETLALAVASLRETYQNLTDGVSERTPSMISHSRDSIERTRSLLARVRARMDGSPPTEAA